MAVESKPLFHPEIIRQHLVSFTLPESFEAARPKLKHWADLITSGKADSLAALREEHTRSIDPARALAAETLTLDRTLSDLINQAYGLTPEEVQLIWDTAPPRMPFVGP